MKFEIKNRWAGSIIFEWTGDSLKLAVESAVNQKIVLRGADLSGADLSGAVLRGADLSGAVLRGADLSGAVLNDADLSGADLRGADLRGAVLRDAVLRDAVLRRADLSGADLRGAVLSVDDRIPKIENLDGRILELIQSGKGDLDMGAWHSCETTHCRAGWAVHLAGPFGYGLEYAFGPAYAGALIYARAYPGMKIPDFHADHETALGDIKSRAALAKK